MKSLAFSAALVLCAALPTFAADPAPSSSSVTLDLSAPQTNSGRTSPVLPLPTEGRIADAVRRGATMEEIAQLRDPIVKTPAEAIRALKLGNARFFDGTARRPELSANERRAQLLSQTPFAAVVGCSDSRVPTEIIYDQGLGSLFISRVAGNIAEPATLGSMEYAVRHLKSKVIVVMGHEGCGAVVAAMLPKTQRNAEPSNIRFLLDRITPAVESLPPIRDRKARLREAVISNVRMQVNIIKANPVIAQAVRSGQIQVIGAFYEISSGAVDFLEDAEELRLTPTELKAAQPQIREAAASDTGHGHSH